MTQSPTFTMEQITEACARAHANIAVITKNKWQFMSAEEINAQGPSESHHTDAGNWVMAIRNRLSMKEFDLDEGQEASFTLEEIFRELDEHANTSEDRTYTQQQDHLVAVRQFCAELGIEKAYQQHRQNQSREDRPPDVVGR